VQRARVVEDARGQVRDLVRMRRVIAIAPRDGEHRACAHVERRFIEHGQVFERRDHRQRGRLGAAVALLLRGAIA